MNELAHFNSLENIQKVIASNDSVLLYFETVSCSVGVALKPKVDELLKTTFPKVFMCSIDLNKAPEIAAYYTAFVEPTILVFFDGKETIRKSRNISIRELEFAIKRPYKLIFN